MLDAFGSCRLCLIEIEGRAGTPASCTTPVAEGMVVRTKSERLDRLRKGIMELYVSIIRWICSIAPNTPTSIYSRLQRPLVSKKCATASTAPATAIRASTSSIPISASIRQVHRLFALRTRLRRGARHLCPDCLRPRLRLDHCRWDGREVHRIRMCFLRRLRAGVPDRFAA